MAKKFRFRLEVVRKVREQACDHQRRRVAQAVHAVGVVERRIDRLSQVLRNTVGETRDEQLEQHPDVVQLRSGQFYQGWLHRKIMEANNDLAGANSKLKEQRAVLGHASAQLKAIEKLRERRFERHQQQLKREEQAGADEIAIRMFDRSSQTSRRRVVGHVVEGAV